MLNAERIRVLLIEDNPDFAALVADMLGLSGERGLELHRVDRLETARAELAERSADCVLLDLDVPHGRGLTLISEVQAIAPEAAVVVLTGGGDDSVGPLAVREGAQDYLLKRDTDRRRLASAVRYAVERHRLCRDLRDRAMRDQLTGMANRALVLDRLGHALARTARDGSYVGVVFVDLDGFKALNDRFGHAAGDDVLVTAAQRIASVVRPSDTVARFGGDEFVVLCETVRSREEAVAVATRIVDVIDAPFTLRKTQVRLTASAGVAFGRGLGADPAQLLRSSDTAMFRAKHEGGAKLAVVGEARPASRPRRRFRPPTRAGQAGKPPMFEPIVELASGRAVALEPRPGPARDAVEPLHRAASWLETWDRELGQAAVPALLVPVPAQLARTGGLAGFVQRAAETARVDPARLWVAVPESVVMYQTGNWFAALKEVAATGALLWLDRFGAGEATVNPLGHLPLDAIRLERAAMDEAIRQPNRLQAVGALARSCGFRLAADGLGDANLAENLGRAGVSLGQGPGLAAPLSAEGVAELVATVGFESAGAGLRLAEALS